MNSIAIAALNCGALYLGHRVPVIFGGFWWRTLAMVTGSLRVVFLQRSAPQPEAARAARGADPPGMGD